MVEVLIWLHETEKNFWFPSISSEQNEYVSRLQQYRYKVKDENGLKIGFIIGIELRFQTKFFG